MLRALTLTLILLAGSSFNSSFAAEASSSQLSVQSGQQYVSEDIGIVMRSGPTNGYRVIGRLTAGTPIEVLAQDAENETTQVKTSDNKSGWISSQYVTSKKSYQTLLAEAVDEKNTLEQSNHLLTQELSDKQEIIALNDQLQQQVSELHNKVEQLEQRASLGKDRFRQDMFLSGGITVLVSMFIAWLLTRTAYGRRQKSGWR